MSEKINKLNIIIIINLTNLWHFKEFILKKCNSLLYLRSFHAEEAAHMKIHMRIVINQMIWSIHNSNSLQWTTETMCTYYSLVNYKYIPFIYPICISFHPQNSSILTLNSPLSHHYRSTKMADNHRYSEQS